MLAVPTERGAISNRPNAWRESIAEAMAHHQRAIRLLADHLGFSSWGFTLALLPLDTLHERRLDLARSGLIDPAALRDRVITEARLSE